MRNARTLVMIVAATALAGAEETENNGLAASRTRKGAITLHGERHQGTITELWDVTGYHHAHFSNDELTLRIVSQPDGDDVIERLIIDEGNDNAADIFTQQFTHSGIYGESVHDASRDSGANQKGLSSTISLRVSLPLLHSPSGSPKQGSRHIALPTSF